jgi:hypothetical protein
VGAGASRTSRQAPARGAATGRPGGLGFGLTPVQRVRSTDELVGRIILCDPPPQSVDTLSRTLGDLQPASWRTARFYLLRLWGAAKSSPDYNKDDWKVFQEVLEELERRHTGELHFAPQRTRK